MNLPIPVQNEIRTHKFLLRPLTAADAGLIGLYSSDERVARMTTRIPHPFPPGTADAFVKRALSQASREMIWAIDAGEDSKNGLVGLISLRDMGENTAEIGYWVAPAVWGTGYAGQAVAAIIENARKAGIEALIASAFQENPASIKVLLRNGFAFVGEGTTHSVARNCVVPTFQYRLELADA